MKLRVIVAVAVVALLVGSVAFSQEPQAFKLEGAWVARAIGFPSPVQWSYVLQPNPSGRTATLHGSVDLGFPSDTPPGTSASPLIGECAVAAPGTATCFVMWYSVLKGGPGRFDTLIAIGTVTSEMTFVAPARGVVTHHFAIYSPDQDADGDGFPDPGQVPRQTFSVTSHDTRLPKPVVQ
jgi:hypothetical protein